MPTEISQLRPEGVQAAVDFAGTVNCKLDPKMIASQVSLIVKNGNELAAVVLAVHSPGGACELHVCVGEVEDPRKLTGELLNKALMKVHGAGVRRCQISHHGHVNLPSDWSGPKWTGEPEAKAEAPTEAPTGLQAAAEVVSDTATAPERTPAPEAEAV